MATGPGQTHTPTPTPCSPLVVGIMSDLHMIYESISHTHSDVDIGVTSKLGHSQFLIFKTCPLVIAINSGILCWILRAYNYKDKAAAVMDFGLFSRLLVTKSGTA